MEGDWQWLQGDTGSRESLVSEDQERDFPGGAVVKNPPAKAGDEPWSGRIPHATEQTKPVCHNY